MKFIEHEKMKSENLDWGELIAPNEHSDFWHHEIVDSTGEVHIGVVYENGAVETAYTVWDSLDTFERFEVRPILHHYSGRTTQTLHWNSNTDELYCEESYRSTCDTHIYRVTSSELLEWFLGITEDDVMELPNTGHICIALPQQLKEQIEQVASAENQSLNSWVSNRLSKCAEDERSRASLTRAADRTQRFREVINRIKGHRAPSAPR